MTEEDGTRDNSEHDGLLRVSGKTIRRPPASARCETCHRAEISPLPTFATGSGIAQRPFADDVFCRMCGHIGPPIYDIPNRTH